MLIPLASEEALLIKLIIALHSSLAKQATTLHLLLFPSEKKAEERMCSSAQGCDALAREALPRLRFPFLLTVSRKLLLLAIESRAPSLAWSSPQVSHPGIMPAVKTGIWRGTLCVMQKHIMFLL